MGHHSKNSEVIINICKATCLKCEGRVNPIGITDKAPSFSWIFDQNGQDRSQSAYRILVSDDEDLLSKNIGNLWDSNKVASRRTYLISYEGNAIGSRIKYFWKVCVWDAEGNCGDFSEVSSFEMGILDESEWQAAWIGGFGLLRKEFEIASPVEEARLYIAGLGYYEARINGEKTDDQVLKPSFTDFEKRVEYIALDVKNLLRPGKNALGIMLGQGWFKQEKRAFVQLEVKLSGGESVRMVSDDSWKGNSGPVIEDSIYNGETYDANLERKGWDLPGYDDSGWQPVQIFNDFSPSLVPQILPPIRVIGELEPVDIRQVSKESYVADFGVNIAGWVRLKVKGEKGTRIVLKFAELVNPDGSIDQLTLVKAKATDTYILNGEGTEIYEPRFTYHGFRYMQVEGYPGTPDISSFMACIVHSDVRETGSFSCSNELFNRIHEAMRRTLSDNMHSIPTDCPQRNERFGWMADAFLASEACMYNFDMHYFYRKWLEDIRDAQDANTGEMTSCQAPGVVSGGYITWNVAYPVMVRSLFDYYGDLDIVKSHYANLKAYFLYIENNDDEDGLLRINSMDKPVRVENFGDWLGIKYTHYSQVDNCMYFMFAETMAGLAKTIGCFDDEAYYRKKADGIKERYNELLLNPFHKEAGYYNGVDRISQTGNALPLYLNMVPEEWEEKVKYNLLWDVSEACGGSLLTTGIIGTKYIMEYLARIGRKDIIYDLFNRNEYPGWGFMIKSGATTVWERWEYMRAKEMNSHNHPALASPDTLFWRVLAGISWPKEENGVRVFDINPYFHKEMEFAQGALDTPWGKASVKWLRKKDKILVNVHLPANTRGRIFLDESLKVELIGSGEYEFAVNSTI